MKTVIKYLLLICCLWSNKIWSQTIGVRIKDTSAVKGATIDIPVYADSSLTGYNIVSYQLKLNYNAPYMSVVGIVSTGTMSASATPSYNANPLLNNGTLTVSYASATALTGTGILFYIRFQLNQSGFVGLSFTGVNDCYFNQGMPVMALKNGTINILNPPFITASFASNNALTIGDSVRVNVSGGTPPYTYQVTNNSVASITSSGMLKSTGIGKTRVIAQSANNIIDTTDAEIEVRALKVSLPDTTILPISNITYPIRINSTTSSNVLSGSFRINFGQGYLVADSIITTGTLLQNASVNYQNFSDYTIVSFASSTVLVGEGDLVKVRFKILNPSNTGMSLQDALFNQNIVANTQNGNIYYTAVPALRISPNNGEFYVDDKQQFTATGGKPPYVFSVTDTSKASVSASGLFTAKKGGVLNVKITDSLNATNQTSDLAVYDGQLSLPGMGVLKGTFANYPVFISKLNGSKSIFSVQVTLTFPVNTLDSVEAILTNTLASGWSVTQNVFADKIVIALAGANPINTNGLLFKLKAKVLASNATGTNIYVNTSNVLFNEGDFYAKATNGNLSVVSVLQKDIGINTVPNLGSSCNKAINEQISASIYNYNNTAYFIGDTLFVGYVLNNSTPVKDTLVLGSNLNQNGSVIFTFKKPANLTLKGSYTLKVFTQLAGDINAANDTSVVNFQVYGTPTVNLGNDTSICQGSAFVLNATSPSASYSWSTGATSATIVADSTKYYWVKVTNSNGCFASDTIYVNVNPLPVASKLSNTAYSGACGLDSIILSTPFAGGYTYRWLFNGNNTINTADTSFQYTAKTSGTYNVKVTSGFGCSALMIDTLVTMATSRQAAPVVTGNTSVCEGDTLLLAADSLPNTNYKWSGPNAFSATSRAIKIADISPAAAGLYSVFTIKNGAANGCDTSTTVSMMVSINSKPVSTALTVSGNTTFCQGDSVQISGTSVIGHRYRWLYNNTNTSDTAIAIKVKTGGEYNISVTNTFGCSSLMQPVTIVVKVKPVTSPITGNGSVIINSTHDYSVLNTAGSNYTWSILSGVQTTGAATNSIKVQWGVSPATGSVKVVETNSNGCVGDTVTKVVTVLVNNPDSLAVSIDSLLSSSVASSKRVGITSNTSWVVTNPVSWITISPMNGSGNDSLTLTIAANISSASRSGIITITAGALTKTIKVVQSGSVGLNDFAVLKNVSLYPNPTNQQFFIENNEPVELAIAVYDLQGRILFTSIIKARTKAELNFDTKGFFIVKLSDGQERQKNIRLVVE